MFEPGNLKLVIYVLYHQLLLNGEVCNQWLHQRSRGGLSLSLRQRNIILKSHFKVIKACQEGIVGGIRIMSDSNLLQSKTPCNFVLQVTAIL